MIKRYRADLERDDSIIVAGKRIYKTHKLNKVFHARETTLPRLVKILKASGWRVNQITLVNIDLQHKAPRRI